jgi:hypothetical protein
VLDHEPEYIPEAVEREPPNVATVAAIAFLAGLVLWIGGACLVLGADSGSGSDGTSGSGPVTVSTPRNATPVPTALPDRTDCNAIRGTDYRSEAERQWFRQNCS